MSAKQYFIYGAGGHAKVIAEMMESLHLNLVAAIDKNLLRTVILGKYPVYTSLSKLDLSNRGNIIIAVGNNFYRKRISEDELNHAAFATIIDKTAIISKYTEIDTGTVVMPGATISVDSRVGRHCIVNTNASIGHDCVIEDYVHISPNASLAGNVSVGEGTHIGIGASVIQGVNIGKWCTIGAGAVIIKDIPDGSTVVGNPGRVIKINAIEN